MEIRVLRYFLAVVREENISKAAESLHLTQPTLSRQLSDLEAEIGQPLFERGRRLALTEAGVMLRHRAEEAVALIDRIEADFRHAEDVGGDAGHRQRRLCGGRGGHPHVGGIFPALSEGAI